MSVPIINLNEMANSQIRITLKSSHRPNVLASVSISIETEFGVLTINDGRILKNSPRHRKPNKGADRITLERVCE